MTLQLVGVGVSITGTILHPDFSSLERHAAKPQALRLSSYACPEASQGKRPSESNKNRHEPAVM